MNLLCISIDLLRMHFDLENDKMFDNSWRRILTLVNDI